MQFVTKAIMTLTDVKKMLFYSAVGTGGQRGQCPPLYFGKSVNPISIRE